MIDIYTATVVWPGREWPDKYNPGKTKVSATFLPAGKADTKANHVRVNAFPGTPKAERLLRLRKGARVALAFVGRGDKSYHDLVTFHGCRLAPLRPLQKPSKQEAT